MLKSLTAFALVFVLCSAAFASVTGTVTLTAMNFNAAGGSYSFDVYGLQTSARPDSDVYVGTSNFYFSYNSAAMSTPSLLYVNSRYNANGYLPVAIQLIAGKIAVTIQRRANPNVSLLSNAAPYGELLFTVSMQVTDPSQQAHVHWDAVNSAITDAYGAGSITNTFAGSDENPLPIQLASFTATQVPGTQFAVRLDWSTASEINNFGFYVQRQSGASAWNELQHSFVPGHGTTNLPQRYAFIDSGASGSGISYRLHQLDLDGTSRFSDPVHITGLTSVKDAAPVQFALMQNYPNPFNPSTEIKFSVEKTGRATLELFNILGQRMATLFDATAEAGQYYHVRFDGSSLASGMYFYRLASGTKSDLKKLVLVK